MSKSRTPRQSISKAHDPAALSRLMKLDEIAAEGHAIWGHGAMYRGRTDFALFSARTLEGWRDRSPDPHLSRRAAGELDRRERRKNRVPPPKPVVWAKPQARRPRATHPGPTDVRR